MGAQLIDSSIALMSVMSEYAALTESAGLSVPSLMLAYVSKMTKQERLAEI